MQNTFRYVMGLVFFVCAGFNQVTLAAETPPVPVVNAADRSDTSVGEPVAEKPMKQAPKKIDKERKEVTVTDEPSSGFYGKKNRNLGDFLVGPYATAVSLPRPISFGLEAKYLDWFGISAGYGFLPQVTVSAVKAKITGYDVKFKIYPFQGAFFIGAGVGSQALTASKSETISGVATTGTVNQDNSFIAPQMGWNWIWDSGFFMGIDLGVQLSLKRTTNFSTDVTNATVLASAEYAALRNDVLDQADKIGKTPLPVLTLVKIGYFF